MKRWASFLFCFLIVFSVAGSAQATSITMNQTDDWGNSDGAGDTWGFICQVNVYEAFFVFDLSSIPDTAEINSAQFGASMKQLIASERTLWAGSTLVGKNYFGTTDVWQWETIDIDSGFDWTAPLLADTITLKLTGPEDLSHLCGAVELMESGTLAELKLDYTAVPEPSTLLLLGSGLVGLVGYRRKFKK